MTTSSPTSIRLAPIDARPDGQAAAELTLAMDDYKARSGRMFPTWSEVLEVFRDLGYAKTGPMPGRPAPSIARINLGGEVAREIRSIFAENGGSRSRIGHETVYVFRSESGRAEALDSARSEYGWSSVDPL